jgi:glycosyltransferase involved in cell wall biosynthesis
VLAILTTHPIQYQTPIWQALAKDGRVPFEVWYLTDHGTQPSLDREFGKTFSWDIDMFAGYPYRIIKTAPGAGPVTPFKCRLREPLRERLHQSGAKALWIQGWQVLAYWQAVWEAKTAGTEVWLRGESNDLMPTPMWKRPLKQLVLGQLFARVDRFFYIGSANRRLYRNFGVPERKLYSAPYAVDNERFERQAAELRKSRMNIRRAWGISDEAFCILFCGKLIPKKRPMDLVGAARQLMSDGRLSNMHLLFAGSGELDSKLRAQCTVEFDGQEDKRNGSSERMGLRGKPRASFTRFLNQTEISRAYVAADCLVLPSDYGETWGLVVNEAIASGLPCIVSRACGCAEDLVDPEWSFPLADIAALADRIASSHAQLGRRPMRFLPSVAETTMAIARAYADLSAVSACCHQINDLQTP